jgi:prephenate dehydrogenase (NADP+)
VVQDYGPCMFSAVQKVHGSHIPDLATKLNAIVAGQTSVKAPERAAFEKYLPPDTHIVSCHSLHGPGVNPTGQPLVKIFLQNFSELLSPIASKVLISHRASKEALTLVESILRCLRSRYVYLSYEDHDLVTANTQAVTHAAFLRWLTVSHALDSADAFLSPAWEPHGLRGLPIPGSRDSTLEG